MRIGLDANDTVLHLITEHVFLKGKSNRLELCIIFTPNLRRETILTVSDNRRDFLCPFDRKESDV